MEAAGFIGRLSCGSRLPVEVCDMIGKFCSPHIRLRCTGCCRPLLEDRIARPFIKNVPCKWAVVRTLETRHGIVRWHRGRYPNGTMALERHMSTTPHGVTVPQCTGWFENCAYAMHQVQPWRTICATDVSPLLHLCIPCFVQRRRLLRVFWALRGRHFLSPHQFL